MNDDQAHLLLAVRRARWSRRLPGLLTSRELMALAQRRAGEIVGDFSHDRAGSESLFWGEDIGWTAGYFGYAAAAAVVRLWLASPEHRAILLGRWRWLGVGARRANGRLWWVVVMGRPA